MSEEKKIIVDEDWKNQIAAEKEELKREAAAEPDDSSQSTELPPASFQMLLTTFATEAMVALGQLPNPVSQEVTVHLDHARYSIDMLQVLEEKTRGNLDAAEAKMLSDLLHQLRMAFVAVQQGATTTPVPPPGPTT